MKSPAEIAILCPMLAQAQFKKVVQTTLALVLIYTLPLPVHGQAVSESRLFEAAQAFTSRLKKGGGEVIETIKVPLANPDFAPFLQRVRDLSPDTRWDC